MRKPRLVEEHEAEGKRIVVDGQHIFVREEGEGEPVLLLHGVPSSSFLFRKMLPELAARGLRAVSFDFPGVGLSDKPKGIDYDWHALAKWVGRVVDTLALPPVHLVLHDIAGPIGAEWAIQNPVKVRSITVTNTLLDVAHFTPPFPMWTFRLPAMRHVAFSTMNVPTMLKLFRYSGVKNPEAIDEDVVASYIYLLKNNGGHHSFLKIMQGFDLTEHHRDWLRDDRDSEVAAALHQAGVPVASRAHGRRPPLPSRGASGGHRCAYRHLRAGAALHQAGVPVASRAHGRRPPLPSRGASGGHRGAYRHLRAGHCPAIKTRYPVKCLRHHGALPQTQQEKRSQYGCRTHP
ncbi:MAG: alpha/beta fold hydrolase [Deltaproteobacteria bacterium]|nr:alpha/beta fold hydrolase [Deltaproteobacteria bacterium]